MIRQLPVAYKTGAATLAYSEMGDIVVDSETGVTLTLPTPSGGLWYRISNVGAGVVTIYFGAEITALKQTEQAMLLSNGSAAWWMSKGSGAMSKAEIEAVLTGEITSHTHPGSLPQATESALGGIKASAKTAAETSEVKIDAATGKLYSTPPGAAANGIPAGGTEDQFLIKNSAANYDAAWGSLTAGLIPITDSGEHFTAADIESALSELFTSVSDGKTALVTDIETKGGTVTQAGDIATFGELSDGVLSIPTGGGYDIGFYLADMPNPAITTVDKPA